MTQSASRQAKKRFKQDYAHELVASTAREFAGAWYEDAAHDDTFYSYYPSQKTFISREWPRFIEAARMQLVGMLGATATPEWQKEQIAEALIKHAALPGNVDKRVTAKFLNLPDGSQAAVH